VSRLKNKFPKYIFSTKVLPDGTILPTQQNQTILRQSFFYYYSVVLGPRFHGSEIIL
jgi:hypothetical protein